MRLKAMLVGAGVLASLVVGVPSANADEAFYSPPSPLPAGADGDVLKSQPSTYAGAKATRVMYLSRNAKNQPIPVTGTVIVPEKTWAGPGERPIVAYAPFTAGMGDQCAPSKTLAGEGGDLAAGFQKQFVDTLLGKGFAVAQTDYEGLGTPGDHTYVMRLSEARTVLDVVRAAQRLPGAGLPADGPVGIAGYSEGGGAAASAAELASDYAPDLDVRGVYSGAPPADKAKLAKSLDGSLYAAFLGYALIGINAAYPESKVYDLANDTGKKFFEDAAKTCTMGGVMGLMFKNTKTLTKDGRPVAEYMTQAPFSAIVAENRIGTLKPAMPVLVEHALLDDAIPHEHGRLMSKDWCGKGANVTFRNLASFPLFGHALGMLTAKNNAATWLGDRFAGKPVTGNCGTL
ncbi:lipase family protein [Thermomonospora umbrina]|uniref:Secretory lipase n=1 Tax=Thermomonospora umbrina TaxID=111806 RepID=A0A3D9T1C0_9ACTN|nr:lipase family protein [Thermomonospora umbrina]REE98594.1 secretory lipase [Thermomonospora umbrina]